MQVVGEDRLVHDRLFGHMPNKGNQCPLKNLADAKYALLPDTNPDPERGVRMRADFFLGWEWHFALMQNLTDKALDIDDFISRIELADRHKLWSRRKLELWEIPYILLVWQEFRPIWSSSQQRWLRQDWLRFWFEGRVRTIDDLWIRTEGEFSIVKAYYAPTKGGGSPGLKQLKSYSRINVQTDFVDEAEPRIHSFVRNRMQERFAVELRR
jgi:hypothetical protein